MTQNSILKTVYFDLGNVLLFFDHDKMVSQVAALSGLSPGRVSHFFFEKKGLEACETGRMSSDELYRIFQTDSPNQFSFNDLMEAYSNIFVPNHDAVLLVEHLKRAKVRLILISNICDSHFIKACQMIPILKDFDDYTLSFQVGFVKPSPQIFQSAIQKAKAPLDCCFYTDDIPLFIETAKRIGLPGVVFTSAELLKNQLIERGCSFLR